MVRIYALYEVSCMNMPGDEQGKLNKIQWNDKKDAYSKCNVCVNEQNQECQQNGLFVLG